MNIHVASETLTQELRKTYPTCKFSNEFDVNLVSGQEWYMIKCLGFTTKYVNLKIKVSENNVLIRFKLISTDLKIRKQVFNSLIEQIEEIKFPYPEDVVFWNKTDHMVNLKFAGRPSIKKSIILDKINGEIIKSEVPATNYPYFFKSEAIFTEAVLAYIQIAVDEIVDRIIKLNKTLGV